MKKLTKDNMSEQIGFLAVDDQTVANYRDLTNPPVNVGTTVPLVF